jgi:REP element-mobilizing transposase RayT
MSIFIHKSHNVSVLIYHLVCPAKYRKAIFTKDVDDALEDVCEEISQRYEIIFLEIGTDREHVHFLIQSIPMYSPKKIAQIVKSITAREIFKRCPLVKKALWGGEFWTDGYFITSVGKDGNESIIKNYVKNQGDDSYVKVHREKTKDEQFNLW